MRHPEGVEIADLVVRPACRHRHRLEADGGGAGQLSGDHNVMPLALSISITPWASVTVAAGSSASTTQLGGAALAGKAISRTGATSISRQVTCPVLRDRNHILPRTPK
jgi:hypothetical protein